TFPGAENLGTALSRAHGYSQYDMIGKRWQTVFKTTLVDLPSPNHDRNVLEAKFNGGTMNAFLSVEEQEDLPYGGSDSAQAARQLGLTTIAINDCDNVPYLWQYAKNFTLADHYFQVFIGPSSPSNLAMLAAQTGISEQRLHRNLTLNPGTGQGLPMTYDLNPFKGPYPPSPAPTTPPSTPQPLQYPLSFAALPMLYGGAPAAKAAIQSGTVGYVLDDLKAIAKYGMRAIPWRWSQEGFVDGTGYVAKSGYVAHHNPSQYFDYLRNNNAYWSHVTTAQRTLEDIDAGTLASGVYYVKGSNKNGFGWKPASGDPYVQKKFLGDNDHPGKSDEQVAEAFVATYVNAIAKSKYWNQSAILIAWDDGGGFYDHVPPHQFEGCIDSYPCGDGQRLPLIVISPYASGSVMNDYSDTASIAKFVENVFNLPRLGSLPIESKVLPYGPGDVNPEISDLADAFDYYRLNGLRPPIPASQALVPPSQIGAFPPRMNCKSLGITPIVIPTQPPYYKPIPLPSSSVNDDNSPDD
ncbi:MAG: hypothetical protein JO199_02995, partial [Candidatus Eremiobacteraeota bacterium]|nr:hypothetical protein [Candidatus Eremiobacteraeota bacterium]